MNLNPYLIAYDLGTGGNKAALFDCDGTCHAEVFYPYQTSYPRAGWHEQRPEDWWQAVVESTHQLMDKVSGYIRADQIVACGISGHSLGAVPLDRAGLLLRTSTPIWSDGRAIEQAKRFFTMIPENSWYLRTGNGFPPALYTVFKILWYHQHEPEMFERIACVVGTKDFINYRLTGSMVTDYSYASGSGVYDLEKWNYSQELIAASGLPRQIFPEIVPSHQVIGTLTREAAEALGLPKQVQVVAGGVDNSCMALGARNICSGRVYNSQGSSSWIAVTTAHPLLNPTSRPFVFTHVIPSLFNSAIGVFSTGTTLRWVRDNLCQSICAQAEVESRNVYELMTEMAEAAPPGANGLIFHPNLAGGSSIDPSPHIRGALLGLDLRHTLADIIRACMEGIALQQRLALDILRSLAGISSEILVVGGGSRSKLWRQIHADVYNIKVIKTNIDQSAAALGAAALAAVGAGLWDDFKRIDSLHVVEDCVVPIPANVAFYERLLPIFRHASQFLSEINEKMEVT